MKRLHNWVRILAISMPFSIAAAPLPSAWVSDQPFELSVTGLVKIELPVNTLDSARSALEDLRVYDDTGAEVPYLIAPVHPPVKIVQNVRSFHASLNGTNDGGMSTSIEIETGFSDPIDGVTLETPANDFIKSVRASGSMDKTNWVELVGSDVIFRQPNGAGRLEVSFAPRTVRWLTLRIDDSRTLPVPFTGARIHGVASESTPVKTIPATIVEQSENPDESRVALRLDAANLDVASIQLAADEPLFMRPVEVAVPQVAEGSISERTIGRGTVYRVPVEGHEAAANLSIPLEAAVHSREVILAIRNGDSPPLAIKSAEISYRPSHLIFFSRRPGTYHLLTGNIHCNAPRYDLAAMNINVQAVADVDVKIPAPATNPDYREPEVLSGVNNEGISLDTSAWQFRKTIAISRAGVQQMELDLDVLAHATPGFADLRLMRGSNQVPYLVQHTSITRSLPLDVSMDNDPKKPGVSRWKIRLPRAGLLLTRIVCTTKTPLFDRSMSLYEDLTDQRGDHYRHRLGGGTWTQTPQQKAKDFSVVMEDVPGGDTIFLETENGDNQPIELNRFTTFYPVTRILFKAQADDSLFLYYGNPRVAPPRYDLSLVADQLLAAEKKVASPGEEQPLKSSTWREGRMPGNGGILFWSILAVVVVVLLVVIAKLLPKPTS